MRYGGLGIRSAIDLAPSAFLASANASADLVHRVVPSHFQHTAIPCLDEALSNWSKGNSLSPPEGTAQHHQRNWGTPRVSHTADRLLEEAPDDRSSSRFLACSARVSGAWLNSLPISSLGLRMDDDTVRMAVGLRLGAQLCKPHTCQHCGAQVDQLATHGLSCRQSEGRHHQHSVINDILHRALIWAHVPSCLEPLGLSHTDGKRPDGVTVVPWSRGKLLVWDATCPDTYAPSYTAIASQEAGVVAAIAEERKKAKYIHLPVLLPHFHTGGSGDCWCIWPRDICLPERTEWSLKAFLRGGEVPCIPTPTIVSGSAEGKRSRSAWNYPASSIL